MFLYSIFSLLLTSVILYFWKNSSVPIEYSFIILGQAHFLLGYYYLYKKRGFSFKKVMLYMFLMGPIFLLLQRDILNFNELAIVAGTLFVLHALMDEFHLRGVTIVKKHIPALIAFTIPWTCLLIEGYYDISHITLLATAFLPFILLVTYSVFIFFTEKELVGKTIMLACATGSVFLFLGTPFLATLPIEVLFAVIVTYHISFWHIYSFKKEAYSPRYLLHIAISSIPLFFIFFWKEQSVVGEINTLLLSPFFYFVWAIIHILVTFRYYNQIGIWIKDKILIDLQKETSLWTDKTFAFFAIIYVMCFVVAVIIHSDLAYVATQKAPNGELYDTILAHIPYYDTHFIHDHISNIVKWFGQTLLFFLPRFLPFMLISHCLLIFARGISTNLTALPPPELMNPIQSYNTFGGDLFFSGHVALPFLYALVFWNIKWVRYTFIVFSVVFAITTLLGRYHYSIDIMAAFFISYGVFSITKNVFKKTYQQTFTTENILLKKD